VTKVFVPLPVQGALDTSGPVSTRPPGTLVEAIETDVIAWRPRDRLTQKSWPYQHATAFPNPSTPIFDGTNGYGSCTMLAKRQFNLPTAWTLDIVFRPTSVTHSSDATVPVFQWWLNGVEAIGLYLKAGGAVAGDRAKLVAVVTPTSSPGVAGTAVTLTGGTQLSLGATLTKTHHVRLVRSGKSLALTADGVSEASSTSFSATQRHEAGAGVTVAATAYLGTASGLATGANHLFNGRIMRTLLRTGAGTDVTKGMRWFAFERSQAVRFSQLGTPSGGSSDVERSLFSGTINWSGVTAENVTEPAPWYPSGIQAGTYFVDSRGRGWNYVMAGGATFWRRAM
jgi:hypothetical protein